MMMKALGLFVCLDVSRQYIVELAFGRGCRYQL